MDDKPDSELDRGLDRLSRTIARAINEGYAETVKDLRARDHELRALAQEHHDELMALIETHHRELISVIQTGHARIVGGSK